MIRRILFAVALIAAGTRTDAATLVVGKPAPMLS